MVTKKVAVLLAIIALVLVIAVFAVNISNSKEVQIKTTNVVSGDSSGQVGVIVAPSTTEDRGNNS